VIDQAYNLRGNVEQSTGATPTRPRKPISRRSKIAETRRNYFIAGESLYSLVALLGDKTERRESATEGRRPFADKYWKEYSGLALQPASPWRRCAR
jgi:hypothetical protein